MEEVPPSFMTIEETMSNLQEFDLTDIAGLNTLKLDNSHYEIAIPGTDISFT